MLQEKEYGKQMLIVILKEGGEEWLIMKMIEIIVKKINK